ncbi:MAG: hypothetical protein HYS86_04085 [Candidatus Chisholmbacteria bacterium]|nr:hypothetical protein [Candidatus Chisholmbacteria bacterium]
MPAKLRNNQQTTNNWQQFQERILTRRFLLSGVGLAVVIFFLALSPRPSDLRVANVTARSFSVGWATDAPSRGCVVVVPQKQWWRWLMRCDWEKVAAHLVRFEGFSEEQSYRVGYVSGLRWQFWGTPVVKTAQILEEQPPLPQPAYGKVEDQFGDPLQNTLIYLYSLSPTARAPIAAMTNEQGNYGLDLANLQAQSEGLGQTGTFVVEVIHGSSERKRFEGDIRMIQPLPAITIETNE